MLSWSLTNIIEAFNDKFIYIVKFVSIPFAFRRGMLSFSLIAFWKRKSMSMLESHFQGAKCHCHNPCVVEKKVYVRLQGCKAIFLKENATLNPSLKTWNFNHNVAKHSFFTCLNFRIWIMWLRNHLKKHRNSPIWCI